MRRHPPSISVLLVSTSPASHAALVDSLRERGHRVAIGRNADDAIALLEREPQVVLVDLAHGAALTRTLVRRLNSLEGRTLVVALHSGSLADGSLADELTVGGFCDARNWRDLVSVAQVAHPTGAAGFH